MSERNSRTTRKPDRCLEVTLKVPDGVADAIEEVLRGFAEEADLDTSLVVDISGQLVAGISSLPEVDVDSIGSLVAKSAGAAECLAGALGEGGRVESLHLGEDRTLYLREAGERFILVGVSDSEIQAGILCDQAGLAEEPLSKLLGKVKALPVSLTKKKLEPKTMPAQPAAQRSLRSSTPGNSESPSPLAEPATVPPRPATAQPEYGQKPNGNGNGNGGHPGQQGVPQPRRQEAAARTDPKRVVTGGVLPRAIAAESGRSSKPGSEAGPPPQQAAAPPQRNDPLNGGVFEVREGRQNASTNGSIGPAPERSHQDRVSPPPIVENSPFEMDEDSEDDSFAPVRPHSTPVHVSVPRARQREAESKIENGNDSDQNSGPRYSFELG